MKRYYCEACGVVVDNAVLHEHRRHGGAQTCYHAPIAELRKRCADAYTQVLTCAAAIDTITKHDALSVIARYRAAHEFYVKATRELDAVLRERAGEQSSERG